MFLLVASLCSLHVLHVLGRPAVPQVTMQSPDAPVTDLPQPSSSFDYYIDEGELEDGYYVTAEIKVNVKRQAVMNKSRIWPNGIVPYVLDKNFTQDAVDNIEAAMREIEQNVGNSSHPCIRFIPRTTETNYLDAHSGDGCTSVVGLNYRGPQRSTFSPACAIKGLLLHELLHTLGIYHEQDRFDRDDFISINTNNLQEHAERDYVLKNMSDIDTLGTPYDFTSIMHYGPYSFPKDPRYPVMTPKPKYATGTYMGQRLALSRLDVLRVQRLYHCPEDATHMQSDIAGDKVLLWCDFENGTCNFTVSTSQPQMANEEQGDNISLPSPAPTADALWVTTRRATVDGPKTGFTNGLDPYFIASRKIQWENPQNSAELQVFPAEPNDPFKISAETSLDSNSQTSSPSWSEVSLEISLSALLEPLLPERSIPESPLGDSSIRKRSMTDKPTQEPSTTSTRTQQPSTTSTRTQQPSSLKNSTGAAPQSSNSSLPPSRVSVSLSTPMMRNTGDMCLDLRLFQQGPTSFLELYVKGPLFALTRFYTHELAYSNHWLHLRVSLPMAQHTEFQLEFMAALDVGSVALDNVHLIKGLCH